MSICHSSLLVVITTLVCHVLAIYSPLHEYRGATFFDGWDYWGNVDNTTWGELFFCFLWLLTRLMAHHKETSLTSIKRTLLLTS